MEKNTNKVGFQQKGRDLYNGKMHDLSPLLASPWVLHAKPLSLAPFTKLNILKSDGMYEVFTNSFTCSSVVNDSASNQVTTTSMGSRIHGILTLYGISEKRKSICTIGVVVTYVLAMHVPRVRFSDGAFFSVFLSAFSSSSLFSSRHLAELRAWPAVPTHVHIPSWPNVQFL